MKMTLDKTFSCSLLISFLLASGCSWERNNQLVKGYGDSGWVEETQAAADLPLQAEKKQQQLAEASKKQHGLMHIHRYGEGYDILLTLDAGDSDVKFVMALPDHNNDKQPQAADFPNSDDELNEAVEHHEQLDEEALAQLEQRQQQQAQVVERTTEHILKAQSLFYKKQYWQALDETNAALKALPASAQAHALKGSIYYKMGLMAEAKNSWQQALALNPELDQVKVSLAKLDGSAAAVASE